MKLLLKRTWRADTYTIGKLYVDGVYFCDTLEDRDRDKNRNGSLDDPGEGKVMHETAIPYGTYKVSVTYSPRFTRDLPRLVNVPHFEGILIHRGNIPEHSSGCILVGENKVKGQVINSTPYELKLTQMIKQAGVAEITIE